MRESLLLIGLIFVVVVFYLDYRRAKARARAAKEQQVCIACGQLWQGVKKTRPRGAWFVFPFNLLLTAKFRCPDCGGAVIPLDSPAGRQLAKLT